MAYYFPEGSSQQFSSTFASAKTITVAMPSSTTFYRVRGGTSVTIKTVAVQGANLVLTYE